MIRSTDKDDAVGQYIRFCKLSDEKRRKYPYDRKKALKELVEECKSKGILAEFVKQYESEVYEMMDILFDQELIDRISYNEAWNEAWIEAWEEGQYKRNLEIVCNMLEDGDSDEKILRCLGITPEHLNELKETLNQKRIAKNS